MGYRCGTGGETVTVPMNRGFLLAGVSLLALTLSTGAVWAQDQEEGNEAEDAAAEAATEAASEAPTREERLVVVATRREGVTVQDVPLSIQAFDAEVLEASNFNRVNDLEQLSPSIQITQGQSASAGTSVSIRGIGTGADNFGFEPAVGIFVDGVFRTRTGIGISELPELSSVEVLRGPQGTLFGRNTSAGVINIQTAKPTFDRFVQATIGTGNFDAFEFDGTISGPVNDNLALRLDGRFRRRDGFIDDLNTGEAFNNIDRFFLRGQALWEKGDASLRFIADYSEADEDCCAAVISAESAPATLPGSSVLAPTLGTATTDAVDAAAGAAGLIGILGPEDRSSFFDAAFTPGRPFADDVREFGFSLEYNDRFRFGNFTSITSYRDFEAIRDQDIDFSGIDRAFRTDFLNRDRTFTQEFRLQDEVGPLDWLVGVFYLNQRIDFEDSVLFGADADFFTDSVFSAFTESPFVAGVPLQLFGTQADAVPFFPAIFGPEVTAGLVDAGILTGPGFLPATPEGAGQTDTFDLNTNSIAIFTHNEITVTDRLTATVGVRYSYDDRDFQADLFANTPACDALAALPAEVGAVFREGAPFFTGGLFACNPAVNNEFNGLLEDNRTDSEVTGTFRLAYEATDEILLFAGFARGFKSGSFNLDRSGLESLLFAALDPTTGVPLSDGAQASDLEFEEEEVISIEAGFKSSWFNGDLVFNASGFYQDISDFQELVFTGTNFVVFGSDVQNFGVEADFSARPIDGLTLQGGLAYTVAERDDDLPGFPGSAGEQLGNTPPVVLTGQATYSRQLVPDLTGFIHANVRWQSATDLVVDQLVSATSSNDAFATVGGRVGLIGFDNRVEVSAFVSNLFNEEFNVTGFVIPEQINNVAVFPGEPRFWGVELTVTLQ